jgi:hypothetical protein
MRDIAFQITERAKDHIGNVLRRWPEGSVPALMFGESRRYSSAGELLSEEGPSWRLAVYDQAQARALDSDYAERLGVRCIYEVAGITIFVAPGLVEAVDGRTLDVEAGAVCIR